MLFPFSYVIPPKCLDSYHFDLLVRNYSKLFSAFSRVAMLPVCQKINNSVFSHGGRLKISEVTILIVDKLCTCVSNCDVTVWFYYVLGRSILIRLTPSLMAVTIFSDIQFTLH